MYRNKDVKTASERLATYLTWRIKLFGNLKEQSFDENPKLKDQIETMFMRILPDRFPTGEAIIYLEMKRHQPSIYSSEDTVKTWHYLVLTTIKKFPDLATHGFVLAGNLTDAAFGNLDLGVPEAIATAVSNCLPLRVANFFVINPPFLLQMVIPVVKLIMSKKLGQRVHVVDDVSVLYSEHRLDPAFLPDSIGGQVTAEKTEEHIQVLLAENTRV
jgi:hypothetical protein